MPRALSVFVCVGLVGCGRLGFDAHFGDASAGDTAMGDRPGSAAGDAATGHIAFGAGSAVFTSSSTSQLMAGIDVDAGDLILVGVSFDTTDTASASATLTDTFGDGYSTVAGPLNGVDTDGNGVHQSIAAGAAGSAGALTVSAEIAGASNSYFEIVVVTYRGTATLPFGHGLAQALAQDTSGSQTTDPVTTTDPDSLVVAYVVGLDARISVETGSTERAIVNGDLIQDTAVPSPGDVPLTFGYTADYPDAEWVVTAIVLN